MTPGRATYGETTMPEENKGFLSVEEVAGNTGEIHSLKPNNNSTIQPIALLRLGVFVPTLKSTNVALRRGSSVTTNTTDRKSVV